MEEGQDGPYIAKVLSRQIFQENVSDNGYKPSPCFLAHITVLHPTRHRW